MDKLRQEERDDALEQDRAYANEADVDPSDRVLIDAEAEDENRDPADREAGTLGDDDALYQDVGTMPKSGVTAAVPGNDDNETLDGLDELDDAVRSQAEDRATGDANDYDS
jgi:hypothetical protein